MVSVAALPLVTVVETPEFIRRAAKLMTEGERMRSSAIWQRARQLAILCPALAGYASFAGGLRVEVNAAARASSTSSTALTFLCLC